MKGNLNKLLFGVSVIIIGAIYIYFQKSIQNQNNKNDFAPSFKEQNTSSDFVEHLDSTTLIYSNFKYGFSIDFPDNWDIDRGMAEHTIIRAAQKDSLFLFMVNVVETKDTKSDISTWLLWDNKSFNMKEKYISSMKKSLNMDINNISTRKIYVSNNEAIEIKFTYLVKEIDFQYEMQSVFYYILRNPYTYTIGIKAPKMFYDENPERFNHLITQFGFIIKK